MSSYDKNQAYSTEWSDDEQPTAYSGNENGGNRTSFEDDSSSGKGVRVRALYDYDGQEQDELTFKAGNSHKAVSTPVSIHVIKRSGKKNINCVLFRPKASFPYKK